jgi:phosphatidylethanolamine/phosphatidyl-N-methylethanolamine N-methyltransferase
MTGEAQTADEPRVFAHDPNEVRRAYARWAPIYDLVYNRLTAPGRLAAVKAASACGTDILEVGVGTGLSLPDYTPDKRVTGIDLSEDMLARAEEKVKRLKLSHVQRLAVMDACHLDFSDRSFDAVAAQMVITLVPDPEKALDEFDRVLRPGGEIVLVNHFGAAGGLQARIEERLAPAMSKIGWSSDFKVARLDAWARQTGRFRRVSVEGMPPLGFFSVVRLKKEA